MKKFLLLSAASLAIALTAKAEERAYWTININDAEHVTAYTEYYDNSSYSYVNVPVQLTNGENTVYGGEGAYSTEVVIFTEDGYLLKAANANDPTLRPSVYNKSRFDNYLSASNSGATYNITVLPEAEMRAQSVTIVCDKPAAVQFSRTGESATTLPSSPYVFSYDEESELPLLFAAANSSEPIYQITVSDGEITEMYGRYQVTPKNGATITITMTFPDEDYTYTLKSNVEGFDFLSYIDYQNYDYSTGTYPTTNSAVTVGGEVVDVSSGSFSAHAGKSVNFNFDTEHYKINSIKENGVARSSTSSFSFTATKNIEFEFDVTKYEPATMVVKTNLADKLTVKAGGSFGTPVEATNGEFTLSLTPPYNNTFCIQAADGYFFKNITVDPEDAIEDTPTQLNFWQSKTLKSCTVNVEVAEIEKDTHVVLFIDDTNNYMACSGKGALSYSTIVQLGDLTSGYNELTLASAEKPMSLSGTTSETFGYSQPFIYLDMQDAPKVSEWSSDRKIDFIEGSVIHVYTSQPETVNVTFDVEDGVTVDAKHNRAIAVTDFSEPLTLFKGNEVSFTVSDNKDAVKLNDEPLTATDGVYTFNADTDSRVVVTKYDGIGSINADNASTGATYNLQGVRVDAAKLPAGIYIRDGKKIYVR